MRRLRRFLQDPRGWMPSAKSLGDWKRWRQRVGHPVLLTSVVVTGSLLVGQGLGLLEVAELQAFDRLMQLRPTRESDPRLLVVGITEEDIEQRQEWPLSDQTVAEAVEILQRDRPRVIGVDIYRSTPRPPGRDRLLEALADPNVVAITKLGDATSAGVAPPPSIPPERVGFNDYVVDVDGTVRRSLLIGTVDNEVYYSLAWRLAIAYLAAEGVQPRNQPPNLRRIFLGEAILEPLTRRSGGYHNLDTRGYQLLLDYHSFGQVSRQVSLGQLLRGEVQEEWIRDKVVLLGTVAPSAKDLFATPYSAVRKEAYLMPGVTLHAQMVSHLLRLAEGEQPLFWGLPQWGEWLWTWGWSLLAGALAWRFRHPVTWWIAVAIAVGGLLGTCYILFLNLGWVPLVPPLVGAIATSAGVLLYLNYQAQQVRQAMLARVQDQERTIALLHTILNESPTAPSLPPGISETTALYQPTGDTNESDEASTVVYQGPNGANEASTVVYQGQPEQFPTVAETSSDPNLATTDIGSNTALPPQPSPMGDRPLSGTYRPNLIGGRYRIQSTLGSGGFGITYRAIDTQRPREPECVIKRLMPARQDTRFLQVARRLFNTEAEILEVLGHHDQIPQLLAYFEENQEFFLVQDFVPGHPIGEELPLDQRQGEESVIKLLTELLEILVFVHDHHVIHRDIKPNNLMRRDRDGRLILIDFGAVKQIQPSGTLDGQADEETVAIGTRGYAPPEQLAGHPNVTSDLYAAGMIGVQALTGISPWRLPVDPDTGSVRWRHLAKVSDEMGDVLDRMVAYHFNDRYPSASAALRDFRQLATGDRRSPVSSLRDR